MKGVDQGGGMGIWSRIPMNVSRSATPCSTTSLRTSAAGRGVRQWMSKRCSRRPVRLECLSHPVLFPGSRQRISPRSGWAVAGSGECSELVFGGDAVRAGFDGDGEGFQIWADLADRAADEWLGDADRREVLHCALARAPATLLSSCPLPVTRHRPSVISTSLTS